MQVNSSFTRSNSIDFEDNYIDTIYNQVEQFLNSDFTPLVIPNLEVIFPNRIRVIKAEQNECILSPQELSE